MRKIPGLETIRTWNDSRKIQELENDRIAALTGPDPREMPAARLWPVLGREELATRYGAGISDILADRPAAVRRVTVDHEAIASDLQRHHDRGGFPVHFPHHYELDWTLEQEPALLEQYRPGSQGAEELFEQRMRALGSLPINSAE